MSLEEVYKSLSDHERLLLLAAFGLPPRLTWVTKTQKGPRTTMGYDELSQGGIRPLITLLERKLIRNLGAASEDDAFKIPASAGDGQFATTLEGNLVVLAILQSEYGYDTQPDWLEGL